MATGFAHVDALSGRAWTDVGGDNVIQYYFANDFGNPWPAAQIVSWEAAADALAAVADISFQRVFSSVGADLLENVVTTAQMVAQTGGSWGGYHIFPNGSPPAAGYYNEDRSYNDAVGWATGGFGLELMMHEIGHGIGLAHPHDTGMSTGVMPGVSSSNDTGDNALNQTVYTIMSYNNYNGYTKAYGNAATPMAFDISALQDLYGANTNHESGGNTYVLPTSNSAGTYWESIWDTGGTDEIVHNGSAAATIDLRAATLGNEVGGGGFISSVNGIKGGFTIAADVTNVIADVGGSTGVIIENATGGSGNDTLLGNGAANVLNGRGGNDSLDGGVGYDQMIGGTGNDTYYVDSYGDVLTEAVGEGTDTVFTTHNIFVTTGASIEVIQTADAAGTDPLVLVGNAYGQQLIGNAGNNILSGLGGIDTATGGLGDDIYVVDLASDVVVELDGEGTDGLYTTTSYTLGAGVSIERLVATPFASTNAVTLRGNEFAQVIVGNNGVNVEFGGEGNDSLYGYGGNDQLEGQEGNDNLFGGTGVDRFIFRESLGTASGIDRIYDMTVADNVLIDALAVTTGLQQVTANEFRLGSVALDSDDRILYNQADGTFRFDADGNGAGAAILFGVLDGQPTVDHTNFEFI